jgi:hypothetical protein
MLTVTPARCPAATSRLELHTAALLRALESSVRRQIARDGYEAVEAKLRDFIFDREHQPVQYKRLLEPDGED